MGLELVGVGDAELVAQDAVFVVELAVKKRMPAKVYSPDIARTELPSS